MTTKIRAGDKVTLQITVTAAKGTDNYGCFTDEKGFSHHIAGECETGDPGRYNQAKVIKIEHTIENWPPKDRDVWKDGKGFLYLSEGGYVYRADIMHRSLYPEELWHLRDNNPVLLYRESKDGK